MRNLSMAVESPSMGPVLTIHRAQCVSEGYYGRRFMRRNPYPDSLSPGGAANSANNDSIVLLSYNIIWQWLGSSYVFSRSACWAQLSSFLCLLFPRILTLTFAMLPVSQA